MHTNYPTIIFITIFLSVSCGKLNRQNDAPQISQVDLENEFKNKKISMQLDLAFEGKIQNRNEVEAQFRAMVQPQNQIQIQFFNRAVDNCVLYSNKIHSEFLNWYSAMQYTESYFGRPWPAFWHELDKVKRRKYFDDWWNTDYGKGRWERVLTQVSSLPFNPYVKARSYAETQSWIKRDGGGEEQGFAKNLPYLGPFDERKTMTPAWRDNYWNVKGLSREDRIRLADQVFTGYIWRGQNVHHNGKVFTTIKVVLASWPRLETGQVFKSPAWYNDWRAKRETKFLVGLLPNWNDVVIGVHVEP